MSFIRSIRMILRVFHHHSVLPYRTSHKIAYTNKPSFRSTVRVSTDFCGFFRFSRWCLVITHISSFSDTLVSEFCLIFLCR